MGLSLAERVRGKAAKMLGDLGVAEVEPAVLAKATRPKASTASGTYYQTGNGVTGCCEPIPTAGDEACMSDPAKCTGA